VDRDWYHAARQVRYVEVDEEPLGDTIFEEHEGSEDPREDEHNSEAPVIKSHTRSRLRTRAQESAERKLAREEVMALIACFIGPLLGTFILHAIRSQLTRSAEGLVSNYNLTVFTMAAEIRPVSHIIKMKQSQTVHLQRVVRGENQSQLAKAETEAIMRRLAEVEARIAEPTVNSDVETVKIGATVRQSLQPQLDALNRAVRRYEKRQAAQSMQLEARFGELEMQLRDALSLAAAAARSGQRPGVVSMAFTWIVDIFTYILQTSWAAATYPLRLTTALGAEIKSWFVRAEHQPRKRLKGQSNGHASNPAPRMQSRTGR
jgi:alkylated DNA nucleotide flippase Atl1